MLTAVQKIKLSRESVSLVAQLAELKGMAKIKAARRLNEITVLLGGGQKADPLTKQGADEFHENLKTAISQDSGVDLTPFERIVQNNEITIETLTGAVASTKALLNSVSTPPIFLEAVKAVTAKLETGELYDSLGHAAVSLANDINSIIQMHDVLAQTAATSELNTGVEPTQEQLEANQYQVAHIKIAGMDIAIENPAGSIRRGVDQDGHAWETTMSAHYGYFENTMGADGDELDVFVVPGIDADYDGRVFVVHQIDSKGNFDEHKIILGVTSKATALTLYQAHYDEHFNSVGSIHEYSLEDFKAKLQQPTALFDSLRPMLLDSWVNDGRFDLLPVKKLDLNGLDDGVKEPKPSIKEPIVVLLHGSKYLVIHGRKRMELAFKNSESFIPAIVFAQDQGYTRADIKTAIKQCGNVVHAEALAALIEHNAAKRLEAAI